MLGAEDIKKIQVTNPELIEASKRTPQDTRMNLVPQDNFTEYKVASLFGLASMESGKYSQEISELVEWAKNHGAKSIDDVLYEIRSLSNSIGTRDNEKKIKTVARYVYLANEKAKLSQDMERMREDVLNS